MRYTITLVALFATLSFAAPVIRCPTGEMSFARCGPHKGGHYARSVNTEGKAIPTHRKGNTRGHYARALVNTEGKAIPTHVGIPVDELVPEYE